VNPYSYIGNNPLSGVDPTGYEAEEAEAETGSHFRRKQDPVTQLKNQIANAVSKGTVSMETSLDDAKRVLGEGFAKLVDTVKSLSSSGNGNGSTTATQTQQDVGDAARAQSPDQVNRIPGDQRPIAGRQPVETPWATPMLNSRRPLTPEPSGGPPVPVPGDPDNSWGFNPDQNNSRGGSYGPRTPVPDRGQPSASWEPDNRGHWDVDDGLGNRRRFDRWGKPLTPEEAHAPRPGREGQATKYVLIGAGSGVAIYGAYRLVRMVPSVAIPPLWPTIIPNAISP
jgi:hypothetical protein